MNIKRQEMSLGHSALIQIFFMWISQKASIIIFDFQLKFQFVCYPNNVNFWRHRNTSELYYYKNICRKKQDDETRLQSPTIYFITYEKNVYDFYYLTKIIYDIHYISMPYSYKSYTHITYITTYTYLCCTYIHISRIIKISKMSMAKLLITTKVFFLVRLFILSVILSMNKMGRHLLTRRVARPYF